MAIERTLSIIKPDGVQKNLIGEVYRRFEQAGLKIIAARMLHLTKAQAEAFYAVHRERPFYKDLVSYMTTGPVIAQVLEGENAIEAHRKIMGATDPKKADPGTIRARLRGEHRGERGARLRRGGNRPAGDQLLLRPGRRLSAHAVGPDERHPEPDLRRRNCGPWVCRGRNSSSSSPGSARSRSVPAS